MRVASQYFQVRCPLPPSSVPVSFTSTKVPPTLTHNYGVQLVVLLDADFIVAPSAFANALVYNNGGFYADLVKEMRKAPTVMVLPAFQVKYYSDLARVNSESRAVFFLKACLWLHRPGRTEHTIILSTCRQGVALGIAQ